jgi:2-keto-4-pentenoate hydratase/2-oxohepta-3-ene-1,7-dioic acid hydratase in catechol pathway
MKLASFRTVHDGPLRVGRLEGAALVDLSPLVEGPAGPAAPSPMRCLLAKWDQLVDQVRTGSPGAIFDLSEVTLLAPVPDPTKVIAAPVNYLDHQQEMSEEVQVSGLGVFLKAPSSLLGSGGAVQIPYHDRRFDFEGELAVVIGRRTRHVPRAEAAASVAGYTCALDVTMRGGEDRSTRKSFDTFTPLGPWLVTPEEAGPPTGLVLETVANGEVRQHASVGDLIWGVEDLVAYASSVMTLEPGDVISTGTPAGVGMLADGDRITVTIDRVGTLSVTVTAEGATACPTAGAGRGSDLTAPVLARVHQGVPS